MNIEKYFVNNKFLAYPYHIFENNKKKYVLSNAASTIFEIDEMIEKILLLSGQEEKNVKKELEKLGNAEYIQQILKSLKDNFLVKTEENQSALMTRYNIMEDENESTISSVTLMLCQECNLRCTYCYGEGGEYHDRGKMTYEVGKKAIDKGFLYNKESSKISFVFFGGEPLLCFDKIQVFTEYALQQGKRYGKEVRFSITTNAILLNDYIAQFLKEHRFSITVSIDGTEESTNINRFYANKKGAYKDILEGIKVLQKNHVPFVVRGTITSKTLNVFENWKHLYDLGNLGAYFSPAVNMMKPQDFDVYYEQIVKMTDHYMECLRRGNIREALCLKNINNIMMKIHKGGVRIKNCGANSKMLAVDIHGQYYPCHRFVSCKECSTGSLDNNFNETKYYEIMDLVTLSNSKCSECWALNLCGGGCPFENYAMTTQINKPYDVWCTTMKKIMEYITQQYLSLSEEQKEYLLNPMQEGEII